MSDKTLGQVAAEQNFWTLSIEDLDHIIDQLEARISTLASTGGTAKLMTTELRDALKTIRSVRDQMLAANYDANRKNQSVRR